MPIQFVGAVSSFNKTTKKPKLKQAAMVNNIHDIVDGPVATFVLPRSREKAEREYEAAARATSENRRNTFCEI